jgi:hypothetical protein
MTPELEATCYFLHIPKTAGTSAIAWLRDFGRFKMCPHSLWILLLQADRASLGQYDLFCGHFYRYLGNYLRVPLTIFTFLRNPLDRAFSHYRHILRDENHYFHDRVREQGSFLAFLYDPVTQPLVRNFQARALSAVFEPTREQPPILREQAPRYWLEQRLETAPSGLSDGDELALAKDCLHRCIFVGISEFMEESSAMLARRLGLPGNRPLRRLNQDARATEPWTSEEWRTVTELNRNDLQLYEYALVLFDRHRRSGVTPLGSFDRG